MLKVQSPWSHMKTLSCTHAISATMLSVQKAGSPIGMACGRKLQFPSRQPAFIVFLRSLEGRKPGGQCTWNPDLEPLPEGAVQQVQHTNRPPHPHRRPRYHLHNGYTRVCQRCACPAGHTLAPQSSLLTRQGRPSRWPCTSFFCLYHDALSSSQALQTTIPRCEEGAFQPRHRSAGSLTAADLVRHVPASPALPVAPQHRQEPAPGTPGPCVHASCLCSVSSPCSNHTQGVLHRMPIAVHISTIQYSAPRGAVRDSAQLTNE